MLTLVYEKEHNDYPDASDFFSPDVLFPEYPFNNGQLSHKHNRVYAMVRDLFATTGLDKENNGTAQWNPLGDGIIEPGNTVLIKPNWVENKNKSNPGDLSCLVTNPAVVRAVIDFVVIALKGNGRIIIADAPMQGCDLQDLFSKTGYDRLFDFYKSQGIDLEVQDLRKYSVDGKYKGVTGDIHYNKNNDGAKEIDLGKSSLHTLHDENTTDYRVEDYSKKETASYHNQGRHVYNVSATVLNADVIINMPKPKTHRLAGLTGAVKNFVGITYDKASLPHRIEGDKETGLGDAYYKRSFWKRWMSQFNEKRTINAKAGRYRVAKLYDFMMKASYVIGAKTSGDNYRIGSWYGNDTIWRTAVDLNNIALHVDANGTFHDNPIRKIISIGDMIISGEKEGPVGPSPKPLGILLMSDNALLFDLLACQIMGFSDEKLPMFNDSKAQGVFGYESKQRMLCSEVKSNNCDFCGQIIDLHLPEEWRFEPHSCWKGHIEKQSRG